MQRFQSILQFKKVSCKNCYKCVRNCPVKAIRVHDHQARIIESQCIYCEKCILVCPQDAKEEQNMIPAICNAMENKTQVIASLHPAYLARFGVTGINGIREAMKKLGFADAADAAEGASLMISQYRALFAEQKEPGIMISSACPVIVQLVKKHYPHLLGNLVQSASMMQFHASYLKKKYPKAEIVYVSPCISAMSELRDSGNEVDYVITLEELVQWMKKEGISITEKEPEQIAYRSREIAIADGLTDLLGAVKGIRRLSVSGMEQCKEVLEELHPEDFENCFLEMYACSGGCVAGPSFQMKKGHYLADVLAVKNAAFGKDFHREQGDYELPGFELRKNFGYCSAQEQEEVSEEEIRDALAEMGKFSPKDELNCGACGYPTCREKAIAVYQKKAELDMCIPFMYEKSKSFANLVMETSPNVVLIVDADMKLLEYSAVGEKYFGKTRAEALQMYLYEFIDPSDFQWVFDTHQNIHGKKVHYPEFKLDTLQNIVYIPEQNVVLATFIDITKEEEQARLEYERKLDTIDLAQKVIHKQMMVAQEIAGLLGETTAETKTTLTKLCKSLLEDGSDNGGN